MLTEDNSGDVPVETTVVESQTEKVLGVPYYKAQAEKFERLFRKSETAVGKLHDDAIQRDESLSAFTARVSEIEQSLEQERSLRFTELKKRVLVENRLDADFMEFLSGSDEETVTAQAKKLADKFVETVAPNKQILPRMGGVGQPSTGKPAYLSTTPSNLGGGFKSNS